LAGDGPAPLSGRADRIKGKAGRPMDTHTPRPDDLNDLEQRLSAWRPSAAGLDADAMLFAAGRASARRAWLAWPVISACTALLAAALGVWLAAERAERLALVQQIRQQARVPAPAPPVSAADEPPTEEAPAPDSYLAVRRAL